MQHTEVAEVTSVTDDREDVIEHFNDECHQKQEVESIALDEMINSVDCLHARIVEESFNSYFRKKSYKKTLLSMELLLWNLQ